MPPTMKCVAILFCVSVALAQTVNETKNSGSDFEQIISMPLMENMEGSIRAEFDVSNLNDFLKMYIHEEVKKGIVEAMQQDLDKMVKKSEEKLRSKINNDVDNRTDDIKMTIDTGFEELKNELTKSNLDSVVGLSAKFQSMGGQVNAGSTVLFPEIIRSHGIQSPELNKFKLSGKFVCEKGGLHVVAATVNTRTDGAWFKIMKNDVELTRTYVATHDGKATQWWHGSTGFTFAVLETEDTISVQAGLTINISGAETSLHILRVR